MIILPLNPRQQKYINDRKLSKKYSKQSLLLLSNLHHPSLNIELLDPHELGQYSFRLDIHYRVVFIFHTSEIIEVIAITNHYK